MDDSFLPSEFTEVVLSRFRDHAAKLRELGATSASVGGLSVTFERPWPVSLAAAIAAPPVPQQPDEPPSDDDYVP